jgi:AraC family transcriptional regulator
MEVGGLRLLESRYLANSKLPKHSHACARFSFLVKGSFTETSSKRSVDWKPLNFGFNLPDEEHTGVVHDQGAHFLIMEVTRDWSTHGNGLLPIFERTAVFEQASLSTLGLKLYKEAHEQDDVSPLAIEGILLEMIAAASRQHSPSELCRIPRWLEQVRELIEATFSENVSLGFLAQSVQVHPVHLARMFRRNYRCTIGEYVRRLRVEFACRQMSKTEAPLREIALAAGFCDQSHFARVFKRQTGLTPAQYRTFGYMR